jgi:hypothetical protein
MPVPRWGFCPRENSFSFSRGPLFIEFWPTLCLQVVGWLQVMVEGWADIRWISARGWAEMRLAWDKSQLIVDPGQLFG